MAACSSGSDGDGRSGTGGAGGGAITDGGIDFVDGAMPPCENDSEGVCVIEDGGVIIQTPDGARGSASSSNAKVG